MAGKKKVYNSKTRKYTMVKTSKKSITIKPKRKKKSKPRKKNLARGSSGKNKP